MLKLVLGQVIKSVGLVLAVRIGKGKSVSVCFRMLCYFGIMSCCNVISTYGKCLAEHGLPLYVAVTGYTGIGSCSVQVFINKIINNLFLKFLFKIKYIVRYTD